MEIVKKTNEFSIIKKRSGRFGVKNAQGQWINSEEKVKILLAEGLIKVSESSAPAEEPAEEVAEEQAVEPEASEEASE